MNKRIMDLLCCPVCKNDLVLSSKEKEGDEIIEGGLFCKKCEFNYPINDGIPNLLPPEFHNDTGETK